MGIGQRGGLTALLDSLIDHYLVLCLFLALLILTLLGVGDVRVVSLLGLLLCVVGLAQAPALAQVDWWVLGPLLAYNLLSAASAYAALGSVADGYAGCQLIWPVLYLLLLCLSRDEQLGLRRLCVAFAGVAAALGLGSFVWTAVAGDGVRRLGGLLGNPNALGVFLVLGWLAWQGCGAEGRGWHSIEALLLAALALTLSMGSFLAMAVGIAVLCFAFPAAHRAQKVQLLIRLLAKAALGVGSGLLLYLAARSGWLWLCPLLLICILVLAFIWRDFSAFLMSKPKAAAAVAVGGVLIALLAVWLRPNAAATFAERLEMMQNGLGYLGQKPLLGVGPYQWRGLNMLDGDKYFRTWHIHNIIIHVGVELGLAAMVLLAVWLGRLLLRRQQAAARAEWAAFCSHNLLDTSFFYLGITAMALLTTAEARPQRQAEGFQSAGWLWRLLFGLLALVFAWDLYCFSS